MTLMMISMVPKTPCQVAPAVKGRVVGAKFATEATVANSFFVDDCQRMTAMSEDRGMVVTPKANNMPVLKIKTSVSTMGLVVRGKVRSPVFPQASISR
jgi:hypothetical protein